MLDQLPRFHTRILPSLKKEKRIGIFENEAVTQWKRNKPLLSPTEANEMGLACRIRNICAPSSISGSNLAAIGTGRRNRRGSTLPPKIKN